jgi:hypothetical protein
MSRIIKSLGGAGIAAVVGVILLGMSGAFGVSTAAAQEPAPPAVFAGSVTIAGQPAAAGAVVEARIGNTPCGVTSVFLVGTEARYSLQSPSTCGTVGATVTFRVNGVAAAQTAAWNNTVLNVVNLTVAAVAPAPPVTGTGLVAETGSGTAAVWLLAVFGIGALAFGTAGATIATRRSR